MNEPSPVAFRYAILTTLLVALTASTTAAQLTFSEGFDGGSNEGGWAWGTGNETISPLNGNPGSFLKDLTLSSFLPTVATQLGTSSEFTGDFAARGVTSVGVDLITLDTDFGIAGRTLTLMLENDNGTPLEPSDDRGAYFVGEKEIPDPGVPIETPAGWNTYDFIVNSQALEAPNGWVLFGGITWPQLMGSVTRTSFLSGIPGVIYLLNSWDVGIDNVRITDASEVCQQDIGFGGPGAAVLTMCGEALATGGTSDVELTGAAPSTLAFGVFGLVNQPVPVFGGTLVPVPWLNATPFTTDGAGGLLVPGVPGGGGPLTLYLQVIYIDATLPGGYGFSNALSVEFLP